MPLVDMPSVPYSRGQCAVLRSSAAPVAIVAAGWVCCCLMRLMTLVLLYYLIITTLLDDMQPSQGIRSDNCGLNRRGGLAWQAKLDH